VASCSLARVQKTGIDEGQPELNQRTRAATARMWVKKMHAATISKAMSMYWVEGGKPTVLWMLEAVRLTRFQIDAKRAFFAFCSALY